MKRTKPRSAESQVQRMAHRWPSLMMRVYRPMSLNAAPCIQWIGPIRGFQREYQILAQWSWMEAAAAPYVFLLDPALKPRDGEDYIDIPHLILDGETPENSALCLFDPDEGQWDNTMWISDTIIPWASEWLHYYEFWQVDGVWRGANAPGPINIREMRRLAEGGQDGQRS